jgi:hypothetical protein
MVTVFGTPSAPEPLGYTLEMTIRGYGGTKTVAVERWRNMIVMLVNALEGNS